MHEHPLLLRTITAKHVLIRSSSGIFPFIASLTLLKNVCIKYGSNINLGWNHMKRLLTQWQKLVLDLFSRWFRPLNWNNISKTFTKNNLCIMCNLHDNFGKHQLKNQGVMSKNMLFGQFFVRFLYTYWSEQD